MNQGTLRNSALRSLSLGFGRWLRAQQRRFHLQWPPVGTVRFGSFRRVTPISSSFARDRGTSIVRHYVEDFLASCSHDIQGCVLEFGDDRYTRMFGSPRIVKGDVLNVVEGFPGTTILADITREVPIVPDTYDCIICTQTLQMIYEVRAALSTLHRILKPGGVLLVTSHGITQVGRHEGKDPWGEHWHFTSQSKRRLFGELFPSENVTIRSYGNVLAAMCFLHGLASEELSRKELDYYDPNYELIIGVRAVKPVG
jgi:SAM-dependent methyltransferase